MALTRLLFTLCCFVFLLFTVLGCQQPRTPNKYLIPQGYVGWVCAEYNVKGVPPLPRVRGYNVIQVPPSGHLKTSSVPQSGAAVDEFYYVNGSVEQRLDSWSGPTGSTMIWGMTIKGGKSVKQGGTTSFISSPTRFCFFVGSSNQFKKYGYDMKVKTGAVNVAK